ncbi:hypothetical protein COCNU_14G006500 [Cocos nucifera]|uniref:Uncharacterized protein n=1 Tax=Cocos nucifera TaxID=13894 RepID=A0A8K0IV13_COCNU|nr:hypothetical protein COCNU_14G006500 [Cocos nucifera]
MPVTSPGSKRSASSFGSHAFTVDATRAAQWDDAAGHLHTSTAMGEPWQVAEGHLSSWKSCNGKLMVKRIGSRNSVRIELGESRTKYNAMPASTHWEVQFRFFGLLPDVEGVLGRTHHLDCKNAAKSGVVMPVVGGQDEYRTSSLLITGLCYSDFYWFQTFTIVPLLFWNSTSAAVQASIRSPIRLFRTVLLHLQLYSYFICCCAGAHVAADLIANILIKQENAFFY